MKAVVFHQHGSAEQLKVEEFPDPVAGPGDVILKIGAAGMNGFDPMILAKTTALKTPLPMVICGDGAGEIVELGAEVDGATWRAGDRVSIYPMVAGEGMTGETRLGAASEYVRIPATNLVRIPDGVSFEVAASLPIAYGTALRLMVTRGRVQAGEKVLVLGATGGVGVCCVQLAKAAGAEVVACGSSGWKLDKLRQIGADHVIDTSRQELIPAVRELYGKPRMGADGGVDMVVNYIGGDTWLDCLKVIHPGGRLLTCGATAGYETANDVRYIWTYELNIMGSNGWTMADQAEILRRVAADEIQPIIDTVRPFAEAQAAMQQLIDRDFFGKLVLVPS